MHSLRISILSVLLAGGLLAQQKIVYADGDSSPTTGGGNAFPFGSIGIRYQAIHPHSLFGTSSLNIVTIRDILIAGNTSDIEAEFDDIEIRMGLTTASSPSTNWSTNNPNPTTVYRGPLRIRMKNGVWGGIGLPKPYLYVPTSNTHNLCVEVICWKSSKHTGNFYFPKSGNTLPRVYLNNWINNQTASATTGTSLGCRMAFVLDHGNISTHGVSCKSSAGTPMLSGNSSWPELGKPITLSVTGAQKSTPGFYVIGAQTVFFDLAPAGSPGCILWNDPLLGVPVVSDGSGAAALMPTIPSTSPPGTVYAHWLFLDKNANAGGLATSDFQTIIVGF